MKKTKFLMAAMALPMLFTACSQDELVDDYGVQNTPVAEGFYATLNPGLDGEVGSRATWLGAKLGWDSTDKISVYWLGSDPTVSEETPANYQFNSIFKTEDGNSFTSESMVFIGGNVAVYPANTANFIGNQNIKLTVSDTQDENTIKSIPYISNMLNIDSRRSQTGNNPGYNNGIDAPLKLAANVLNLTFELKNTAALSDYGFAVESVELHADNAFATEATIVESERNKYTQTGVADGQDTTPYYASEQEYYNGSSWTKVATITKNLWVNSAANKSKLTSTAITVNADGTYTAQFVILPTNVTSISNPKIVINTTCGHVDITPVTDNALTTSEDESLIVSSAAGKVSLSTFMGAVVADAAVQYEEGSTSKFIGEKTGRIFMRSITADMNNATLNNSRVYSSADIIRYVNIYNKMGKENTADAAMNLVLSSKTTSTTFAGLTKAALAAVDNENNYKAGINYKVNVTLSAGVASNGVAINKVQITDAGEVYDIKSLNSNMQLVLGAGEWTMNDVLALDANITKICNQGTLTVNGTTDRYSNQMTLVEPICNEGTLKIGGNNVLQVADNLTTSWLSTTVVGAGQNLIFTKNIGENKLNGTINVNDASAFLTTAAGVNVVNNGVINNYGTVAAEGGTTSNGFINKADSERIGSTWYYGGIINVMGNQAITYVHDNELGEINMVTRTDEIMVASELKGQIVYPYTAADGSTFKYTIDDRFTCVKFGKDVTNLTLFDYNDASESEEGYLKDIKDLSFVFTGTTSLKAAAAKDFAINNLTVNSGANLRVLSGNKLTVNDLTNKGIITIGGYIYYKNNYVKGTVYSQGGAIKNYTGVSYAQQLVNDAIASAVDGETEITLDRNITLDEPLDFSGVSSRTNSTLTITLNLNGYSIVNNTKVYGALEQSDDVTAAAAIYLNDANVHLIINGDDETKVSVNAEATYQSAVWVRNGKVTINGGNYYVGKDDTGNGCTTIQGYAKSGAESYIIINDGVFSCDPQSAEAFAYDQYACLNLTSGTVENAKTYITVNGGKFYNFNPANNCSEGVKTNYVSENCKVIATQNANPTLNYVPTWTDDVVYEVVAK